MCLANESVRATVSLHIDADVADIFEVKEQRIAAWPSVSRTGDARHLRFAHERRGFEHALDVAVRCDGDARLVGTRLLFELELGHGDTWTCELDMEPSGSGVVAIAGPPRERQDRHACSAVAAGTRGARPRLAMRLSPCHAPR